MYKEKDTLKQIKDSKNTIIYDNYIHNLSHECKWNVKSNWAKILNDKMRQNRLYNDEVK